MTIVDIAGWILLVLGSFFCFVGALGLIRLPDFYSRVHAAGVVDSLGAILILLGLMTQTQDIFSHCKINDDFIIYDFNWTNCSTCACSCS